MMYIITKFQNYRELMQDEFIYKNKAVNDRFYAMRSSETRSLVLSDLLDNLKDILYES